MGTSASSNGPGFGVSLDPEWLDDIDVPNSHSDNTIPTTSDIENSLLIAPKARFSNARRRLNDYARTGNTDSLRKALGHYSKTGMGGSRNLSNRMRTSAKVAASFVSTLRSIRDDANFALSKTLSDLKSKGANASEVINAIIDSVCPNGGSLDESSTRDSGTVALSEFMDKNPEADISKLTDDQIWSLASTFLGNEAFSRIQLDIGQSFEKQDISIGDRITRINEMREYLQAEISTQLNKIRESATQTFDLEVLFKETIKSTFEVYEVEV